MSARPAPQGFPQGVEKRNEPALIGDVLRTLMREFAPAMPRGTDDELERIRGLWSGIVGRELSAWTRVVRYRGGVLTVEVDSAPLLAELRGFGREDLLRRLVAAGLDRLHDLRFRAGSGRGEATSSVDGEEVDP